MSELGIPSAGQAPPGRRWPGRVAILILVTLVLVVAGHTTAPEPRPDVVAVTVPTTLLVTTSDVPPPAAVDPAVFTAETTVGGTVDPGAVHASATAIGAARTGAFTSALLIVAPDAGPDRSTRLGTEIIGNIATTGRYDLDRGLLAIEVTVPTVEGSFSYVVADGKGLARHVSAQRWTRLPGGVIGFESDTPGEPFALPLLAALANATDTATILTASLPDLRRFGCRIDRANVVGVLGTKAATTLDGLSEAKRADVLQGGLAADVVVDELGRLVAVRVDVLPLLADLDAAAKPGAASSTTIPRTTGPTGPTGPTAAAPGAPGAASATFTITYSSLGAPVDIVVPTDAEIEAAAPT